MAVALTAGGESDTKSTDISGNMPAELGNLPTLTRLAVSCTWLIGE